MDQTFLIDKIRFPRRSEPTAPYAPKELEKYSGWHETLDEFIWLFKVFYGDAESIKSKRFRLDRLLASYVRSNKLSLAKVRQALDAGASDNPLVVDDLKRGWYNELAYAVPLRPSMLGLGFEDVRLNLDASAERFAFPSWPIVTAYYSVYFFLRSIILQKQPNIRLDEHAATLRSFKYNVFGAIDDVLLFFPFNLSVRAGVRSPQLNTGGRCRHWNFEYARHPRPPRLTPAECLRSVRRTFKDRANRRGDRSYGLFDWFHDFRVWVNYQDIDSMLTLWGGGYRAFLDMNTSAVTFLIASLAEVAFVASYGSAEYLKQLQRFYERVTEKSQRLHVGFTNTPMYHRLQVLRQLNLIDGDLVLRPIENRNRVSID
jgi:hypothetical protein